MKKKDADNLKDRQRKKNRLKELKKKMQIVRSGAERSETVINLAV